VEKEISNFERWGMDISDSTVNKVMLNAKHRVRNRKPLTKLQRKLMERAIERRKAEIASEGADQDKPLERPE